MKRTGIKRGTKRLERRTELKHGNSQMKRTRLRNTSRKRDRENRERKAMVNDLFPDGPPKCALPKCRRRADDVHEPLTRARGGSITDPDNAVPLCRTHHDELGDEPEWAYRLGLLIHSWEDERGTLPDIAEVRRSLLAGEEPVIPIAYCAWCRLWLAEGHACPYGGGPDVEDLTRYGTPGDLPEVGA